MKPMVSIVIPIKRVDNEYWTLLNEAIKSVLRQTYTDYELLIGIYDKDVSDGRNEALGRCVGEYCLTLDADDTLEPSFLAKTIPLMTEYDIVATDATLGGSYWSAGTGSFEDNNQILNCSLFKKEIWNKYKFDDTLGGYEDWDWNLKAIRNGYKVGYVREALVNISDRPNSRNKNAILNHNELKAKICQK